MQQLHQFPIDVLKQDHTPYLSLILNLDEQSAYSERDEIALSNLLKEAKQLIDEKNEDVETWHATLERLRKDQRVILNNVGNLLFYATKDEIYYYHLDEPVEDKVVFGETPYTKPLIKHYQFDNEVDLLILSQDYAELYHASRNQLSKVDNEHWPLDLATAIGTEIDGGGELSHGTYGSRGTAAAQTFHGHNETSAEKEIDRDNFFRKVDEQLSDTLNHRQSPLVVYALTENLSEFLELAKYDRLADTHIEASGVKQSEDEIKERVSEYIKQHLATQRDALLDDLKETSPEFKIEDRLDEIKAMAEQHRIDYLAVPESLLNESDVNYNELKQLMAKAEEGGSKVYILNWDSLPLTAKLRY